MALTVRLRILVVSALLLLIPMARAADSTTTVSQPAAIETTTTTPADPIRAGYPAHWWGPVPKEKAASWEVLPQEAGPGEVILSKRNELGLLSNFSNTTFTLYGKIYPSLEGFWQMMLYPEGPDDPRATAPGVTWKYTREQVAQMVGFEANAAGALALKNMKTMGIDWISYKGQRMGYYKPPTGETAHYDLIVRATRAKLHDNPRVREVLLSTGDLRLRPDHHQPADAPPSWHYFDIYMQLRQELRQAALPSP